MKRKITVFVVLSLLFFHRAYAQEDTTQVKTKKEIRKSRPTYVKIGTGFGSAKFRDFATSPLFYKGKPFSFEVSRLKKDEKREGEFGGVFSLGTFSEASGKGSKVKIMDLYYSQLYKINPISSDKWTISAGGLANLTGNIRVNAALQNNSFGLDIIPTLYGSVKAEKTLSTEESEFKKFWFIKFKPKKRVLSYRLNTGIFNSSYRNGYAYLGPSGGTDSPKLIDGYEFKAFSGLRMGSELDYTIYMKNKNALRWSYLWDVYRTGTLDKFEMASHTLQFSLLFNTK